MRRILALVALTAALAGCACKCRINEYTPDGNKLSVPPELRRASDK